MEQAKRNFEIYLTVLRFISYKITDNLRTIYLDIDDETPKVTLTALYRSTPSELELELFDDICTDTEAHLPESYVDGNTQLLENYNKNQQHNFVVFAMYEP